MIQRADTADGPELNKIGWGGKSDARIECLHIAFPCPELYHRELLQIGLSLGGG